jgi:phenylalanyl-tRNA synthetase beta chain
VLSFPPIINSELTRVTEKTKNLLIDVTATDLKAAEDALAILAMTLYDAKFRIESVKVNYSNKRMETPNMHTHTRNVDLKYINSMLGLKLRADEAVRCLRRSRIGAVKKEEKIVCNVPRYRLDIMHNIDIVEDVAVGYNIKNMSATFPRSASTGARDAVQKTLDHVREVMIGLGMIEVMNFNLVSKEVQYAMVNRGSANMLAVEQTKSMEHEVLRDSLIPSLLLTLSRNIHEPYPQLVFEIGKMFHSGGGVDECWSVAAVVAHKDANYTEMKSYLQALLKTLLNVEPETRMVSNAILAEGRSASIYVKKEVGVVGEVNENVVENFKLRVPVSVFELNVSRLLEG